MPQSHLNPFTLVRPTDEQVKELTERSRQNADTITTVIAALDAKLADRKRISYANVQEALRGLRADYLAYSDPEYWTDATNITADDAPFGEDADA